MMHDNELKEMKATHSYFPYQSDLGLVQRTAYSSVVNPNLFFFLHVSGTLFGSVRSKNARQNTENNLENNTMNSIIFAHAFKRNISMTKAFTEDGEEIEIETAESSSTDFVSVNGAEWFDYMAKRNFRLTDEMKEFVKQVKTKLGQTREGQYNLL